MLYSSIDLSTRKHYDNSYYVRLYSLKLQRCFSIQVVLLRRWATWTVKLSTIPIHKTSQFTGQAT